MTTAPAEITEDKTREKPADNEPDGMTHKVCPCRRSLPPEQHYTRCGRPPSKGGWAYGHFANALPCVVCEELVNQPCRYCGMTQAEAELCKGWM